MKSLLNIIAFAIVTTSCSKTITEIKTVSETDELRVSEEEKSFC